MCIRRLFLMLWMQRKVLPHQSLTCGMHLAMICLLRDEKWASSTWKAALCKTNCKLVFCFALLFLFFFFNKTNREMFGYSWCGCYSGVKPFLLWQPNISAESWIIPAHSSSIDSLSPEWSGSKTYFYGIIEYLFNICYAILYVNQIFEFFLFFLNIFSAWV